jgi:hypothetical protein
MTDTLYDVHPEPVDTFWYWMRERQAIHERRFVQGLQGPWTDDPILRTFAFCNLFREQDRVTVWVRENIREPFAKHPNLWIMLAIARTINWPETLAFLMDAKENPGAWPLDNSWDPKVMGDALDRWKALGQKVYTGAYMIRAESDPSKPWYTWTKQQYVAQIVIGKLWEKRGTWDRMMFNRADQPTLQEVHAWLAGFHGWGPFMSYEVVTDLRHTRYLDKAPDIMTWANAGPGAIRGLKRMHPQRKMTTPADFTAAMQELLAAAPAALPGWPTLELRDIEHSLCEFDKYSRVKHGEGRPRALFKPASK